MSSWGGEIDLAAFVQVAAVSLPSSDDSVEGACEAMQNRTHVLQKDTALGHIFAKARPPLRLCITVGIGLNVVVAI